MDCQKPFLDSYDIQSRHSIKSIGGRLNPESWKITLKMHLKSLLFLSLSFFFLLTASETWHQAVARKIPPCKNATDKDRPRDSKTSCSSLGAEPGQTMHVSFTSPDNDTRITKTSRAPDFHNRHTTILNSRASLSRVHVNYKINHHVSAQGK